jgi:hypothetical protein
MKPNTHQEHPEDLILTGDLSVFDLLYDHGSLSMKMDGVSLVWGTNPHNGLFFVCTKAAFNKQKVRLCYDHNDIIRHFGHQPEMVNMLSHALTYLPKTDNIYWGDWLGYGDNQVLQPNTISYLFPEVIQERFVVAPHTVVTVTDKFSDAECVPLTDMLDGNEFVRFVQPSVDRVFQQQNVPQIDTSSIPFLTDKQAYYAKQQINDVIRRGHQLDDATLTDILGSAQLANLYQLVIEIKNDLMDSLIITDSPRSFVFEDVEIDGEGFVFYNDHGSVKLVDRPCFAYANFNSGYSS